jgi:collagenase-like PrtC family protease
LDPWALPLLETLMTRGRAEQGRCANWCYRHWWQSLTGGKINTLNEEFDILGSTNFKLLSQTKGNSVNNCDFFKFTISVEGSHYF